MNGVYFLYLKIEDGELSVDGPHEKRDEAEQPYLTELAELVGVEIHPTEFSAVLRDGYRKKGFDLDEVSTECGPATLFLRELLIPVQAIAEGGIKWTD